METSTLSAHDGRNIPLCHWPAIGSARRIVLIAHGLIEYAARYECFALQLAAAELRWLRTTTADTEKAQPCVVISPTRRLAKRGGDVDTVVDHVRNAHPRLPVVLYGHSMGSFIARAYLFGLALSATGYHQKFRAYALRTLARLLGRLTRPQAPSRALVALIFGSFNLGFLPTRTPVDWFSRDPAEVNRYLADPLCGFAPSGGLWQDLFGGIIAIENGEKTGQGLSKNFPVLLLAVSRDPVSLESFGLGQLARRDRAAGLTKIEVKVYADGRHEMHHETNHEEFMTDLLQWLNRVVTRTLQ